LGGKFVIIAFADLGPAATGTLDTWEGTCTAVNVWFGAVLWY
jgi:hypothetical protein